MNSSTYFDLSQSLNPDFSLADHMEYVYNMRDDLDHRLNLGYSPVDIAFQRFLEQSYLSEREKDMITISHFFNGAWKTIHITIIAMKETPTPYSAEQVIKIYTILEKYNLQHLLYNKLSEKQFLKIYNKIGALNHG